MSAHLNLVHTDADQLLNKMHSKLATIMNAGGNEQFDGLLEIAGMIHQYRLEQISCPNRRFGVASILDRKQWGIDPQYAQIPVGETSPFTIEGPGFASADEAMMHAKILFDHECRTEYVVIVFDRSEGRQKKFDGGKVIAKLSMSAEGQYFEGQHQQTQQLKSA